MARNKISQENGLNINIKNLNININGLKKKEHFITKVIKKLEKIIIKNINS